MSNSRARRSVVWAVLLGGLVLIGSVLSVAFLTYGYLFRNLPPVASSQVEVVERPAPPAPPAHGAPRSRDAPLSLPESPGYAATEDSAATLPINSKIPIWGGERALVTVLLFGDVNCPFTRHVFRTLARFAEEMPLDLRLAWRHRPTTAGGEAMARFAARLYETQGAKPFWKLLDLVSRRSESVNLEELPDLAGEIGLTRAQVLALVSSKLAAAQVQEDMDLAVRYGVRRTPTLFINGIRIEGLIRQETLREIIESERRAQVSALALGVARPALYATRVKNTFVDLGTEPPLRRCVPLGKAPTRGARDASVTLVLFSDFQCHFCGQMRVTLDALMKSFGQRLRIAWRNFPLDDHPQARAAANLAMHATNEADPDAFWKVHDALFDSQAALGTATYERILDTLKLDKSVYLAKVEAREYDVEIDRDIELGHQLGVTSVPTSFINGRKVEGALDLLTLAGLVAEELENMRRLGKAGYDPQKLEEALCQPR